MLLTRKALVLRSISYLTLVLLTAFVIALSAAFFLSQAVRSSPHRSWKNNFDAVVVGAAYAIVFVTSLAFCLKRRITVYRKLQRISKTYRMLGRADAPESVYWYIQQEYARACLITYESEPKHGYQEGWGQPGSKYEEVRFRTALLDTIREIDTLAHEVIPHHPTLRPHVRMLHHFRFILPLLPLDEVNLTPLHYWDSAIQLVRHASREPTEPEYIAGMDAAAAIQTALLECRPEMLEESTAPTETISTSS